MDVALCFDQHFALPGALAILSLVRSNPGARVHAITDADDDARRLIRAIADAHGADVRIIDDTPEAGHAVDSDSDYGTRSTATYRRLFLPELLPELDRVLFIDADVMVRSDLRSLWDQDLGGAALGAVSDPWYATLESIRARFPAGYFNAGMLLIDLNAWRAEAVTARAMEMIRHADRSDGSDYRDQTPLNQMLIGRWRPLSHRWNFTTLHSARLAAELGVAADEHARASANPDIVHFLAGYKPWVPGFEAISRWHAEYDAWRREIETCFGLGSLRWPGAFIHSRQTAIKRRALAMRLLAAARSAGFVHPRVLLTGLLGHEIALVAREQAFALGGFASESSAMQGGRLLGLPIDTIDDAIAGTRDFIVGDYRRLARMRAPLDAAAARHGVAIRAIDIDSLRRAA